MSDPQTHPGSAPAVKRCVWAHGQLEVQALGGMLGPIVFRAAGCPDVSPMHVAPWSDERGTAGLDGLLRRLRGEWPCVPFGRCDRPDDLAADWTPRSPGDAWSHGYASHHPWTWLDGDDELGIAMRIDAPSDASVSHLIRRIRPDPVRPAVDISLEIHARAAVTLPVALHPTFALGAGRVRLRVPSFESAHTYPVPCEAGVSRLRPDTCFHDLEAAPADPRPLDLTHYPLALDTEELLQLRKVPGEVHLDHLDTGWCVTLSWPPRLLPDLMLWISHRGRRHPPWNGRHLALGLEPVNGPFDLGRVAQPPAGHPLADRQGLRLDPDRPVRIDYRIVAQPAGVESDP